jgi:hypothetical protein
MGHWVIEPSIVSTVFGISENVGIWQDGWDMDIRSGCHAVRLMETPSKDGTSICHVCNTKFWITNSPGSYDFVLTFGSASWDGVDKNIIQWIDYWIGYPDELGVLYSGKTWRDALYVEDWETV